MKKISKHLTLAVASVMSVGVALAPAAVAQSAEETASITTETTESSTETPQPGNQATSTTTQTPTNEESATTEDPDPVRPDVTAKAKHKGGKNKGTVSLDIEYKNLKKGNYSVKVKAYKNSGEELGKEHGFDFSATQENGNWIGEVNISPKKLPDLHLGVSIVDGNGKIVAEIGGKNSKDLQLSAGKTAGKDGESTAPEIRTSAALDVDVIQSGAKVSDTVNYTGLVAGEKYTIETRLMCKDTAKETGDAVKNEFTADKADGKYVVENIEVTDPDCLEQVVFEKLYDSKGNLVATHEDIDDKAQTIGGARDGKKKKKKKDGEGIKPSMEVPAAPKLTPLGGGEGSPAPGRAVIGSVPSGEFDGFGMTIFER